MVFCVACNYVAQSPTCMHILLFSFDFLLVPAINFIKNRDPLGQGRQTTDADTHTSNFLEERKNDENNTAREMNMLDYLT